MLTISNMKKTLFLLACGLVAASCAPDLRSADNEIEPAFTSFNAISDECTDEKLALWFDLFNQYQEEGFEMYEADEKARKQVEAELASCGA